MRLTALEYLVFFVPDFLLETTHHIAALPPRLAGIFIWGAGGGPVAVMFSTVYIVWALFLFAAARAPLMNRLFLDYNLVANTAHFTMMLIMAATMRAEHHHLASVIALGMLTTVPLAACWLPVRHAATTSPLGQSGRMK